MSQKYFTLIIYLTQHIYTTTYIMSASHPCLDKIKMKEDKPPPLYDAATKSAGSKKNKKDRKIKQGKSHCKCDDCSRNRTVIRWKDSDNKEGDITIIGSVRNALACFINTIVCLLCCPCICCATCCCCACMALA